MYFLISFCLFVLFPPDVVLGKECTNTPTQLSSHTVQYELFKTNNLSWRDEMYELYHLTPTDDSTWANLRPRGNLIQYGREDFNWEMLYRCLKNPGITTEKFLKEVSLHDVRLDPDSIHGRAAQTNLEYLLLLDEDSLVWSFRKTANLSTPGKAYGGWEDPAVELRGHFVGHYLSASARMWASTHNDTLYQKMSKVVSALHECQEKIGTGYLSAFPDEQFDRVEAIKPVWAPYYTIHKIMSGLLDQYLYAGNNQTLRMVVWMAEYFSERVENVISKYTIERHWTSLNEESGGMNDVLYRLYTVTGDQKHLVLAYLFDKPCFLGLLAVQADSLSGFHSNTHIPVVLGSQMRYEVTGDPLYKAIGTYFMDIINSSHCYATGGTSVGEFWSDPKRLAATLETENEESCTTYNMLKVSRNLFRWTKEMAYVDYYERALTNGVLSIQRGTEPGVMIYMLPLGRGQSKAHSYHGWGTQFDTFWCCYGTGIESFSKLGDSIYFEEDADVPGLYIIQYISSSFNWKSGQIMLKQDVEPVISSDAQLRVSLSFSTKEGVSQISNLYLRIPFWTNSNGAKATLNSRTLPLPFPGNFMSVTKSWSSNDKLTVQLPISLRLEAIKDERPEYASVQAILFGPYLLAGLSDGDWDLKPGTSKSLSEWIIPIPPSYNSQLVSLTQEADNTTLVLTNANNLITMDKLPEPGTDSAVHATFRLVPLETNSLQVSSVRDLTGKSVMLEPIDLPGLVVAHQGRNKILIVTNSRGESDSHVFRVVSGLGKKSNTFSLESESDRGCFFYSVGDQVELRCKSQSLSEDDGFNQAVSFTFSEGMSEYHPISFTAKGVKRNFLLVPLLSLRDESYTVYFNIVT
ncbi:hypothetical protein MRB53_017579 [Persea americana]|uniref:Uncharacterized protein n=1 Tax=Persea americana TaxID=3435 RepID=A0ACC2M5G7_PERAE|nr:hypothetical protein MRB53_017579 [Persea americana]